MTYSNIGALILRIGLGGPLYYNYNKEPPKIVIIASPILDMETLCEPSFKIHGNAGFCCNS